MTDSVFPKIVQGTVVSDRMDKTVVVEVVRLKKHPIYKKYIKLSKRYKAHDAENKLHVGDRVSIQESRPLSKTKHWVVVEHTAHTDNTSS